MGCAEDRNQGVLTVAAVVVAAAVIGAGKTWCIRYVVKTRDEWVRQDAMHAARRAVTREQYRKKCRSAVRQPCACDIFGAWSGIHHDLMRAERLIVA